MSRLNDVKDEIVWHLDEIKKLFLAGAKVTILVRRPTHSDGSRDLVITDDQIDEAIAALLCRKRAKEPAPDAEKEPT